MRVGVLAVQGAFALHRAHLEALGARYVEVSRGEHLRGVDGLILPGGESGVMLRLITEMEGVGLEAFARERPVWGICAGAILLAREVWGPRQASLGTIDIVVERNAYGRQRDSSEGEVEGAPVSFIRAPRIVGVGSGVRVLARRGPDPVWVEAPGGKMATTFHPETRAQVPSAWHRRFVASCVSG